MNNDRVRIIVDTSAGNRTIDLEKIRNLCKEGTVLEIHAKGNGAVFCENDNLIANAEDFLSNNNFQCSYQETVCKKDNSLITLVNIKEYEFKIGDKWGKVIKTYYNDGLCYGLLSDGSSIPYITLKTFKHRKINKEVDYKKIWNELKISIQEDLDTIDRKKNILEAMLKLEEDNAE